MTARILVVDDIATNVKLLEARLMAEYFQVLTASNGRDALEICQNGQCDLVLLDVMMPDMDGFETCRRLKQNRKTMHLPVVMVTALDQPEDRVKGLDAGADDFLTKPVNDLALVTRVKSLVRLKMLTDDLRLRATNGEELALDQFMDLEGIKDSKTRPKVVIVDDRASSYERMVQMISAECEVTVITDPTEALFKIAEGGFDTAIVSLSLEAVESLRLCSHLRSLEKVRNLPILIVADQDQEDIISRALEFGVNDYVRRPIDTHELLARLRTQVRRKRYHDCLRDSVQQTVEMAVKDSLSGLHNRRFLDNHLESLFEKVGINGKPVSVIMCDIDHFKAVNDTHGHDAGDEVIKECARRIKKSVRNIDLACRYGGEEFVVIMPDTEIALAKIVAERIRIEIAAHPVIVQGGAKQIPITISMGVADMEPENDTPQKLLKRADVALYNAKRDGRNRVVTEAA